MCENFYERFTGRMSLIYTEWSQDWLRVYSVNSASQTHPEVCDPKSSQVTMRAGPTAMIISAELD